MLDLKKLLDGSVDSVSFSVSLQDCDFIDPTVSGSATAEGIVTNHSGLVLLDGSITPCLTAECARCGIEVSYSAPIALHAKITDKLANDDEEEFILLEDFAIDVEDLVRTTLLLELPTRFLCKEDCKGLCPTCGKDLNNGPCDCDNSDHDPRWDVLKDFFGE